jgi:uncharacterized Zn-binding protein involved in type VI secretion|tara:strand:- start:377 stop:640 length:264 start_codon:yes stop_codon:yes gene_type:complete
MPGVARNNDTAGGDLIPSQSTVSIDGQAVIVSGDGVAAHGSAPHLAQTISSGLNSTVSINGIDIVVAGDTADVCGEVASGSGTVTIG